MLDYTLDTLSSCSEVTSEKALWIRDAESGVCEFCSEEFGQFKVVNPNNESLTLLKIDGCVFDSPTYKRCDCSLSTKEKLYFLEFKEKVDFLNSKSRRKSKQKAKQQLVHTIIYFKRFNIELHNTFAIVVLTPMLPHTHREIVTASQQIEIADFMSKTGCPNLMIGNILEL